MTRWSDLTAELAHIVELAIADAVEVERAACEKIAHDVAMRWGLMGRRDVHDIVEAIKARKAKPAWREPLARMPGTANPDIPA